MKISAIIVTHNRLELLNKCINAIRFQIRKPDAIIVVNNGSTDGTVDWLKNQNDLIVITQTNLGGAGGQYTGIKEAYRRGYDWMLCMDDDTIPDAQALSTIENVIKQFDIDTRTGGKLGWICSQVLWTDGSVFEMNAPVLTTPAIWTNRVLTDRIIPANCSSFVSICFSREAVKAVGFPLKEYFIWLDDIEYTTRITGANFIGLLALDSKAIHSTKHNKTSITEELNWNSRTKFRYGYRNTARTLRTGTKGIVRFCYRFFNHLISTAVDLYIHKKTLWIPWAIFWLKVGLFFNPKAEKPTD